MEIKKSPVILVADDEDKFRKALVDALTFFDYKTVEAKNGYELTEQAKNIIAYNLNFIFIVDNQMPENNDSNHESQWCGYETIIKLCEKFPEKKINNRVIFLSRWGIEDLSEELKMKGEKYDLINEKHWKYVYTPFSLLKAHIENLLSNEE